MENKTEVSPGKFFNNEKYQQFVKDLKLRLDKMTDKQRQDWLKKKSAKFTRKMVAKCLKS